VMEHAAIVAKQDRIIPKDLPPYLLQQPQPEQPLVSLQDHERNVILRTLKETDWNKHQTAKRLKITRSTLYGKMKRYGIFRVQN